MTRFTRSLAALGLAAAATLTTNEAAAQDDAVLSVLHGVPGLTVDVYVNGALQIDDFTPGTLNPPLTLPAGTYTVAIVAGTDTDDSNPVIGPIPLPLAAGMNYTAVAHLDATGGPTATLFTNDTSPAGDGEGKATVRHTAANAEGVEVVVNGSISLGTFNNGGELGPAPLAAGTYSAEILAGTTVVAPTPADVPVTAGQNTIVYAWGDARSGPNGPAVELAVQTVPLAAAAPAPVMPTAPVPTMGALGMGVMVAALLLFARRFITA